MLHAARHYASLPLAFQEWVPVPKNDTDCWLWTGKHHRGTNRALRKDGKMVAYWSWELHFGPVPVGHKIITRCGDKSCVNPSHLRCIPRKP